MICNLVQSVYPTKVWSSASWAGFSRPQNISKNCMISFSKGLKRLKQLARGQWHTALVSTPLTLEGSAPFSECLMISQIGLEKKLTLKGLLHWDPFQKPKSNVNKLNSVVVLYPLRWIGKHLPLRAIIVRSFSGGFWLYFETCRCQMGALELPKFLHWKVYQWNRCTFGWRFLGSQWSQKQSPLIQCLSIFTIAAAPRTESLAFGNPPLLSKFLKKSLTIGHWTQRASGHTYPTLLSQPNHSQPVTTGLRTHAHTPSH